MYGSCFRTTTKKKLKHSARVERTQPGSRRNRRSSERPTGSVDVLGWLTNSPVATWQKKFQFPWREAGPPAHHEDTVDSDQCVVNQELSLTCGAADCLERNDRVGVDLDAPILEPLATDHG